MQEKPDVRASSQEQASPGTDRVKAGHDAESCSASTRLRRGRRMDRRLPPTCTPAVNASDDLIVVFPHRPGTKARRYDFNTLGLPPDLALLLAHGARNHPVPLAHDSHQSLWHSIRAFAAFMRNDNYVKSVDDFNTEMVGRYKEWLDHQKGSRSGALWSQSTRAKRLVDLRTLVGTIKVSSPELLSSQIVFPAFCYEKREKPSEARRLNEAELKSILWCCQQEIREIRHRFEIGQRILFDGSNNDNSALCNALKALQELNETGFPTEEAMIERGFPLYKVNRFGLSYLRSHLSLTAETAAPFFVSLLVQLAGNVEPVLNITRNCAMPDPVDERLVVIEWKKPRAGPAPGSTQRRFFEANKPFSPPRLVSDLLALSEPLVARMPPLDRERLFVCWRPKSASFGAISYGHMAYQTKKFIARAHARIEAWNHEHPDRPRAMIPAFELRDLRSSAATQNYLATKGDIRRTRKVLNHKSASTTQPYINDPLARDLNHKILASLQRQMIHNLLKRHTPQESPHHQDVPPSASFGHECQNPTLPSMDRPAELCPHFQQCRDCPGLVVFLTAENMAWLLKFEEAFESGRERLHPDRWKFFYADTYHWLRELLSLFPEQLKPEALSIVPTLPPVAELE